MSMTDKISKRDNRSTRHGGTSNNNRTWSSSSEEEDEAGEMFFFRLIDFLFGHGTGTASSTAQRKNISSIPFMTTSSSLSPVTNVRVGRSAEAIKPVKLDKDLQHLRPMVHLNFSDFDFDQMFPI
ncbi:hypothetical protein GPALN_012082 [Globodera pallida]|nr:hypothetical protein GPALN_012082 [Globodera pallida]